MQTLPPGLQGYVLANQQRAHNQAQQLGMLGQLVGIHGNVAQQQHQQQVAPLQLEQLRQGMDEKKQKLGMLQQFAEQLPPEQRAAFVLSPETFIKDMFGSYSLRPGEQRMRGAEVVAQVPDRPSLTDIAVPGQPGVRQKAFVRPDGTIAPVGEPLLPEILNPAVQAAKQKVAASGASRTNVTVNPMRETFKDEQALRGEYTDASKSFIKLAEGYSKVKGALASDATKSAPATLAAATQFMKMLDPESVVRESELGMALSAAGVWDRFTNLYNTVQNGKVLTPQQSKEFARIADVVYDAANKAQQARVQHFQGLAKSYNFDPSRVVPDLTPKATNAQKPAIDVSFPRPTPQAINRLKMRPAEKAQFEAVFGPGSAETYLK
jgi:hypothetical protein